MCKCWESGIYVFFFNDTATTEIYTLSLHDALPILGDEAGRPQQGVLVPRGPAGDDQPDGLQGGDGHEVDEGQDRKSTRLNSSHANISYAVFCLKKKKTFISRFSYLSIILWFSVRPL